MHPQIKVCGLTVPEEAAQCAALGADAIGVVFYPPSPRNVSLDQARLIREALPDHVPTVGVFVDPTWEQLDQAIQHCRLGGVQLQGAETPELVKRLKGRGDVRVFKVLFALRTPFIAEAERYAPHAFLVECGQGKLPGGNARAWDWSAARDLVRLHPTILAGGLDADNAGQAIGSCLPDAVDASSSLESVPGRKDLEKVGRFIASVRRTAGLYAAEGRKLRGVY